MINITIKYFAIFRDITQRADESIEISSEQTIEQIFDQLNAKYQFGVKKEIIRYACNNSYVSQDHRAKGGDVIAFIYPIAGG